MKMSQSSGMSESMEISDLELGWRFRNAAQMQGGPSIELIAKRSGVSPRTVRRKIRLTYLVPQLYELTQKLACPQCVLLDLSYLTPVQQINVVEAAVIEGLSLTAPLAAALRACAEKENLTIDEILSLCRQFSGQPAQVADTASAQLADTSERLKKHAAADRARMTADKAVINNTSANISAKKYAVDDALFPPDLPLSCRENYIAAALRRFRETFPP